MHIFYIKHHSNAGKISIEKSHLSNRLATNRTNSVVFSHVILISKNFVNTVQKQ